VNLSWSLWRSWRWRENWLILISTVSTDLHRKQAQPVEFSKNHRGIKIDLSLLKWVVEMVEIVEIAR